MLFRSIVFTYNVKTYDALNSTGALSLGGDVFKQSVNYRLFQEGKASSNTAQISFNDANVRTLTATTTLTALILPTNFYGK